MLKFFVRCHVHSLFVSSHHANVSTPLAVAPCRAAPCSWEAVRHCSPGHCTGGSASTKLWRFHHPFLLLPDPAFAFWSGANESRFIASLAECKISRREEIGKIPSLAQGSVRSLPPASNTQRCRCSPCNRPVGQGMLPLRHSSVPGSSGSKGCLGVTGAITGCHHKRLSLIFLPSPTLKASIFSPLFLLPDGFQNPTCWLVQDLLLISSPNIFMIR